MKFLDLKSALAERNHQGLLRQRLSIGSQQNEHLLLQDGQAQTQVINFASNDYLGLASHSKAKQALAESSQVFGFGSGGSHLVCGHQTPHDELELALAQFVERDSALTFASGYMANLAILQSLAKKGDVILADKLNHASLIDGAKLSAADSKRYQHVDMTALEQRLKASSQNKFVVTDGVFSMDGDLAPLKTIVELCEKYQAILVVDDAHGFGVLGENGRGSANAFGLSQKQLPVYMATLGKAVGGYGAFVAGEKSLIDYLIQHARSYIYTTAMPAAVASANLANLHLLMQSPQLQQQLKANITYFRALAKQHDLPCLPSDTAIQPVMIGDNETLLQLNQGLIGQGFLVGAIRPPTVAKDTARLRITLTAGHSKQQIESLVLAITRLMTS